MKEFLQKVESIKSKMDLFGYNHISEMISHLQLAGGTPGEIFQSVSFYLNKLKTDNSKEYQYAREDIDNIIRAAKSIGYL